VLVLVPGGAFEMGCQSESPDEPGYDPDCVPMEAPPHAVELAPFLIGKHEVTQSQWLRLAGENPSFYEIGDRGGDARIGPTHPVEELSWWSAREMLSRFGLELPTEAQWEYGCRAGTRTVFAYGDTPADLAGAANIADEGSARHYTEGWKYEPGIVDGYDVHAPIGSFAPNAFGLHDVHGNVWEWCEDRVGTYWLDVEPGSGLRRASLAVAQRVCRGGSYFDHGKDLRSARRLLTEAVAHSDDTGARAARALEP
jgi:formylglycine-generating enzyme required for sulfatase activity